MLRKRCTGGHRVESSRDKQYFLGCVAGVAGYVAYGVLNTKFFGSVYIGTGEQNADLPFLLP